MKNPIDTLNFLGDIRGNEVLLRKPWAMTGSSGAAFALHYAQTLTECRGSVFGSHFALFYQSTKRD